MKGDPAERDTALARTLAAAADVVRAHLPDADGWCLGCLALWGRLVLIEQCAQLRWAAAVHATCGAPAQDRLPAWPGACRSTAKANGRTMPRRWTSIIYGR